MTPHLSLLQAIAATLDAGGFRALGALRTGASALAHPVEVAGYVLTATLEGDVLVRHEVRDLTRRNGIQRIVEQRYKAALEAAGFTVGYAVDEGLHVHAWVSVERRQEIRRRWAQFVAAMEASLAATEGYADEIAAATARATADDALEQLDGSQVETVADLMRRFRTGLI